MADLNVSISDLRTRITLQAPTINKDAGGAQTEAYTNVPTNPNVWSAWVYDHGAELVESDAQRSVQRATVIIRHRSDVLSTWRILLNDQPWKISAPPEPVQNKNRWLVLRVEHVEGSV